MIGGGIVMTVVMDSRFGIPSAAIGLVQGRNTERNPPVAVEGISGPVLLYYNMHCKLGKLLRVRGGNRMTREVE